MAERKKVPNRNTDRVEPRSAQSIDRKNVGARTGGVIRPEFGVDRSTRTAIFNIEQFRKSSGELSYSSIAKVESLLINKDYSMAIKDNDTIFGVDRGEMIDERGATYRPPTKQTSSDSKAIRQKQQEVLKETLRDVARDTKATPTQRAGARKTLVKVIDSEVKENKANRRQSFRDSFGEKHKDVFSESEGVSSEFKPKPQKAVRPSRIDPNSGRSIKALNKIQKNMMRPVNPDPTHYRSAISAAVNEEFNKRLGSIFSKLKAREKIALISGRKKDATDFNQKVKDAYLSAQSIVEMRTLGSVRLGRSSTPAQKRIWGTIHQTYSETGQPVGRKRIQPTDRKGEPLEGTMPLSKSQTIRIDSKGRRVVGYSSERRKASRGDHTKLNALRQKQAMQREAKQKSDAKRREVEAKRKRQTGRRLSTAKADAEAVRQRIYREQIRREDERQAKQLRTGKKQPPAPKVTKDPAVAQRKAEIAKAKRIQKQLHSIGNRKTLSQLLKSSGMSMTTYKRSVYLSTPVARGKAGMGTRSPGTVMTGKRRTGAKAADIRSGRFPAMQHAAGKSRRGMLVDSKAIKAVSGNMVLRDPSGTKRRGVTTAIGGQKYNLYGTTPTISTPKKFYGMPRGVMMMMPVQARIMVDVSRVLLNLNRAERAVRNGIIAASDAVGKKMLDIIEPYVPKDKGYMYQSAKTNVDQSANGMISFANGVPLSDSEMYGVSVSYNTPYAEIVYFDTSKAHGAEYNQKYGVQEKGEKETARWIEVAMEQEQNQFRQLLGIWAQYMTAALNKTLGTGSIQR